MLPTVAATASTIRCDAVIHLCRHRLPSFMPTSALENTNKHKKNITTERGAVRRVGCTWWRLTPDSDSPADWLFLLGTVDFDLGARSLLSALNHVYSSMMESVELCTPY